MGSYTPEKFIEPQATSNDFIASPMSAISLLFGVSSFISVPFSMLVDANLFV
jgi:hypothetical protein